MDDHEEIRKFESCILDKVHEKIEFYKYSDDIVIPCLLQAYGDTERQADEFFKRGFDEISFGFYLTNMVHGISHCIRWIKEQRNPSVLSIQDDMHPFKPCMEFIHWGMSYHNIAQEFITWSRGLKTVALDINEKHIEFSLLAKYDYSKIYCQQLLYHSQVEEIYEDYPREAMKMQFDKWLAEIDINRPPLINSIKWANALQSPLYPQILSKIEKIIYPELAPETDLGGYSLQEFRQFYSLFFINFIFLRWIEDSIDLAKGYENSFGSNPLYLNEEQFLRLGATITNLEKSILSCIIKDLTFDSSNIHSSISIQPFIRSNSGIYYVLPSLFCYNEPARMIAGALNKGSKKRIYSSLINQIEKQSLENIKSAISANTSWKHFVDRTIKSNGRTIQPDVIIIDKDSSILVVADYKHFITPSGASDVQYKIKEVEKGIAQVTNYIDFLSSMSSIGNFSIEKFKIIGFVITYKPLPIPIPAETCVGITNVNDFILALSDMKISESIQKFIKQLKTQKESSENILLVEKKELIIVEDWKISRTIFSNQ